MAACRSCFPTARRSRSLKNSAVECISPTRVRLLAGTMDHVQRAIGGGGAESTAHLPPELNVYGGAFDQYGAWQYDAPYGYVWYPTVAADWRPYYYGYWSSVPTYGPTWIGVDAWSWPTHHYGRWGYARNRWFWIPGRTWGAAWVSWASAPGYVSWCPLGFDGRPVFAFYGIRPIVHGLDGAAARQLRRASLLREPLRRRPATAADQRRIRPAQSSAESRPHWTRERQQRAQCRRRGAATTAARRRPAATCRRAPRNVRRASIDNGSSSAGSIGQSGFTARGTRRRATGSVGSRRRWCVPVCRCITASRRAQQLLLLSSAARLRCQAQRRVRARLLNSGPRHPRQAIDRRVNTGIQRMEPRVAPSPGVGAGRAFLPSA
jgi:hypothetical protein